jgi:hypothetical protein
MRLGGFVKPVGSSPIKIYDLPCDRKGKNFCNWPEAADLSVAISRQLSGVLPPWCWCIGKAARDPSLSSGRKLYRDAQHRPVPVGNLIRLMRKAESRNSLGLMKGAYSPV